MPRDLCEHGKDRVTCHICVVTMPRDLTVGDAHEVLLQVRDTFPRLSREREALAVVSNALDERDALRALLRECRGAVAWYVGPGKWEDERSLLARLDAALGGEEKP